MPAILDSCLKKTRSGESHDYRDGIVFEKFCFQNDFRPHENGRKGPIFKFLRIEECFRNPCFG